MVAPHCEQDGEQLFHCNVLRHKPIRSLCRLLPPYHTCAYVHNYELPSKIASIDKSNLNFFCVQRFFLAPFSFEFFDLVSCCCYCALCSANNGVSVSEDESFATCY